MTKAKKPAADGTLSAEAQALGEALRRDYAIEDPAGIALIGQLMASFDAIRACEATIRRDGWTVRGSRGQPVAHPLATVLEGSRRSFLAIVRTLRLDISEPNEG